MSYARFGNTSDVYVYADVGGYVACCGCILGDTWDFHSPEAIVEHLQEHRAAGHKVPDDLLDESMYPPGDFIAMCTAFMCREDEGHGGSHSAHRWGNPFPLSSEAADDYRCPCGLPREDEVHTVPDRAFDA